MDVLTDELDSSLLVIRADISINAADAEPFLERVKPAIAAGGVKVIVDCSALEYVSSYGVGLLLKLHKELARQQGQLRLAAVSPGIAKLLAITRLDLIFTICGSVDEARGSFARNEKKPVPPGRR